MDRYLAGLQDAPLVPRDARASEYPRFAALSMAGAPPGSSAQGENPRFTARVEHSTRRVAVIVKMGAFSWNASASIEWGAKAGAVPFRSLRWIAAVTANSTRGRLQRTAWSPMGCCPQRMPIGSGFSMRLARSSSTLIDTLAILPCLMSMMGHSHSLRFTTCCPCCLRELTDVAAPERPAVLFRFGIQFVCYVCIYHSIEYS